MHTWGYFFLKKSKVTYYKKGSLVSCVTIVYLAAFHSFFFFLVGIIYFVYQEKACHGQTAYGPHVLLDEIATPMFLLL